MCKKIKIGSRNIGEKYEPFIIAEAGINHNGDINIAKKMIDAAKEAKADAVKFQTFCTEDFLMDKTILYTYNSQGKKVEESMFEMFKRTEFTDDEWWEIKKYCDTKDIIFLSTPVSVHDAELLVSLGVSAIKVGSDDFINTSLIKKIASYKLPLLLACGMADENEIENTIKAVDAENNDICLLLCTSQYPTPENDVNAKKIITLRRKFSNVVIGFSDHSQGSTAAILAVAYGASIFEKHFTLDHDMPGPDHWFSSNPDELTEWVAKIKEAHKMLGSELLHPTAQELEMRILARRSIIALGNIVHGEKLTKDNIGLRRPGTGILAYHWENVIGKTAEKDIPTGKILSWEDINRVLKD